MSVYIRLVDIDHLRMKHLKALFDENSPDWGEAFDKASLGDTYSLGFDDENNKLGLKLMELMAANLLLSCDRNNFTLLAVLVNNLIGDIDNEGLYKQHTEYAGIEAVINWLNNRKNHWITLFT